MPIDTEIQLSLLSEALEIEYRGAVPGSVVREVVTRTARELQRTDGTPAPLDTLGSAVKRRLVGLITLPRQRRSAG